MRLTLRTLLAYLDGVLDPDDAHDLQEKIEHSPMAQQLVARIEENLRRSAQPCAAVDATGADDANLVAEYLDSTLKSELEPEFERHCLESEGRLGEVASCHRVLSMVVRERTAVSQHLRERMHGLREQGGWSPIDPGGPPQGLESRPGAWLNPPGSAPTGGPSRYAPAADSDPHLTRASSDEDSDVRWRKESRWRDDEEETAGGDSGHQPLPASAQHVDYPPLVASEPRRNMAWPLLFGLLAIGLGIFAVRPDWLRLPWSSQDLAESLADADSSRGELQREADRALEFREFTAPQVDRDELTRGPSDVAELEPELREAPQRPAAPELDIPAAAEVPVEPPVRPEPALPPTPDSVGLRQPEPVRRTPVEPLETDPETARVATERSLPAGGPLLPLPTFPEPGRDGEVAPDVTATAASDSSPTDDSQVTDIGSVTSDAATEPRGGLPDLAGDAIADEPSPPPAAPPAVTLVAATDVILQRPSDGDNWTRVSPHEELPLGQELAVLPTFRVTLANRDGLMLTVVGPSKLRLLDASGGRLLVDVEYGQLIAETGHSSASTEIVWRANQRQGTLSLHGAAQVALQANHVLPLGADPSLPAAGGDGPIHRLVQFRALQGEIAWTEGEEAVQALAESQVWNLVDGAPPFATDDDGRFAWLDGSDLLPIEPKAAQEMEQALPAGGAVVPVLAARVDDRRLEQEALAVRCLAMLGQYDQAWQHLNRGRRHSYWTGTIQALRLALTRDPATADKVRQSIESLRQADGRILYRLLRGFTQEDLDRGAAVDIVEALDHDMFDIRVLAAENLVWITGRRNYRPGDSRKSRAPSLRTWQKELAAGRIRYAAGPSHALPVPVN